jgi:nucleoside-diphosphate-sugar epimerase
MSGELHVIFGTGPVGCWTARALRSQGRAVRAVNRSGKRPALLPADVEMARADASDAAQATFAAHGASVVYQAMNPPYHEWALRFPALQAGALAAARSAGAAYVSIENLYPCDASRPMTEDAPFAPRSRKGEVRRRMAEDVLAAHQRGEVRATALRSADYYGPGSVESAFGGLVVGNLVAGRKAQIAGSATQPHSFAYVEDVGRAAAALGTSEQALGKAWLAPHAPPLTQGEMVAEACRVLGIAPKLTVISPLMMRLAGLFVPGARETVEMMYEFTEPFVVDASLSERTFGLAATPIPEGIARTVAWFRERAGR